MVFTTRSQLSVIFWEKVKLPEKVSYRNGLALYHIEIKHLAEGLKPGVCLLSATSSVNKRDPPS